MERKINIKEIVKEKYSAIARQSEESCGCCCGTKSSYSTFSENYNKATGYNPDADLSLGCGLPTEYAGIKPGNWVLDLGSGAGNDCFVARAIVGETGHVTGLDFSDDMLAKARKNNQKAGFNNIEFVKGDIENIPLPPNSYDVVISNCVLNLVPDKPAAFKGILQVIKPGGHFCISDVVVKGSLPEDAKEDVELYAGCVAGAMNLDDYLAIIQKAGFENINVAKLRKIEIPDEIYERFPSLKSNPELGIFSATILGYKPSK